MDDRAIGISTALVPDMEKAWRPQTGLPGKVSDERDAMLEQLYTDIIERSPLETTDATNAEEWSAFQAKEFVYNHTAKCWMRWVGSHWQVDTTGQVVESVKTFAQWIWDTTDANYPDNIEAQDAKEIRNSMAKKVRKLGDMHEIGECLAAARSIPSLCVEESMLDAHPELINFSNLTYDLKTHMTHAHSKDDYLTKTLDFKYDSNATAMPNFESFMLTTFGGDAQMIDYVYDGLCDSISGIIHRPVLQFWYGGGKNGKSILWNTMMRMLGPYALKINFSVLQDRTNPDRAQNEKARLKGIRFVVTSEVSGDSVLNEAVIKDIVSNDTMEARKLRQSTFQFTPTHHVVMVGNHQPRINESSIATRRRLVVIPFNNVVPDNEVVEDNILLGSFVPEYAAIINRLLQSYRKMQDAGWSHSVVPDEVKKYTEAYWDDNDIMKSWMDECCDLIPGESMPLKRLFEDYCAWADTGKHRPISHSKFTRRFKDHIQSIENVSTYQERSREQWVHGVRLRGLTAAGGDDGDENGRF